MDIQEYVKDKLLLFDGAMGTYFLKKAINPMERCELANINQKDIIKSIHREYINAGCNAIKTNTFSANRQNFGGDGALVKTVIEEGFQLAQECAGEEVFVFADIGPIEEDGNVSTFEEYKFIVDEFIAVGAQNFIFETLSNYEGLEEISNYIKTKIGNAYIITSFAIQPDGYTRDGHFGQELFSHIESVGNIDALGLNCISGPYHILQYIKELSIKGKTLSVMPNAGYPTVINNRTLFDSSPEYFAEQMEAIVKQGVTIIGGCCGTTPVYIAETAKTISSVTKLYTKPEAVLGKTKKVSRENRFFKAIFEGKKVIAVELDPPADADIEKFMENAEKIKKAGANIITIADCPVGRARMDSSLLACKIKREVGIDALPHITCRDRNINATKALLLGINIEKIDNVLVVTGDPIPSAQRDEVKSVFNFNSRMLAKYISTLNETILPSPFGICGALNVNAPNFSVQLELAKAKIKNGMEVFLTQPVMTKNALENLERATKELDAKILGGIMPVVSYRNACFMNSEISGITVSEEIIGLYKDKTPEECKELAVKISVETAKQILPFVDGLYIITPFSRADIICEIIEELNI